MTPPAKNNTGVANKKGRNAFFSFLNKPGATNIHICAANTGNDKKDAAKKATLISVKNFSVKAV